MRRGLNNNCHVECSFSACWKKGVQPVPRVRELLAGRLMWSLVVTTAFPIRCALHLSQHRRVLEIEMDFFFFCIKTRFFLVEPTNITRIYKFRSVFM